MARPVADAPPGRRRGQPGLRKIPHHRRRRRRISARRPLRPEQSGASSSRRCLAEQGRALLFQAAVRLAEDRVVVSPVELDVDDGVVQMPDVPTLRVAAPLFGSDHRLFGIVVVNVDMRQVFDRIRISIRNGEAVYVVGRSGDYLVHPDRTREFGSQLGTPTRWQDDFPYFAAITGSTQGATQVVPGSDGKPSGTAIAPAILAEDQWSASSASCPTPSSWRRPSPSRNRPSRSASSRCWSPPCWPCCWRGR
ncbi:cache domain-containing protein [Bradyrhizobium japonicum]